MCMPLRWCYGTLLLLLKKNLNSQQITNYNSQLLQADVHRKEASLWIWLSQEWCHCNSSGLAGELSLVFRRDNNNGWWLTEGNNTLGVHEKTSTRCDWGDTACSRCVNSFVLGGYSWKQVQGIPYIEGKLSPPPLIIMLHRPTFAKVLEALNELTSWKRIVWGGEEV